MLRRMLHLFPPLAAFWLLLSGHYTTLLLVLGLLSVVLVVWVMCRIESVDKIAVRPRPSLRVLSYAGWLVWAVLQSSIGVLRYIWSPRLDLTPTVGSTPATDLSEVGTVAYANSITLTPGTLSLKVDGGEIEVHSLEESGIEELRTGEMVSRVRKAERP